MSDFKAHVDKIVGEDNRHRVTWPDGTVTDEHGNIISKPEPIFEMPRIVLREPDGTETVVVPAGVLKGIKKED